MDEVKKQNQHVGSSFDDFLIEEGLQAKVTTQACREVIAWIIADAMEKHNLSKTQMAARMSTSRQQLDRLLNPHGPGITLDTLERAAAAVGKRVTIGFEDVDEGRYHAP